MATRSQKRKEKQNKKRQQKKKAQQRKQSQNRPSGGTRPTAGDARQRQRARLSRQAPRSWAGERPEDVAVFDDTALESLPPEFADQVAAVRGALQLAGESRSEDALARVATIPRSSPMSEWRLFIRGLVSWMANDSEAAGDAWKRLDPERRAGRIAVAMMNALRDDLERGMLKSTDNPAGETTAGDWSSLLDEQLLYHAKLLRRARFDRIAIRAAESAARVPEESRDIKLGPRRVEWLKEFAAEFRDMEPDLVAALEQTALQRAFAETYSNLFDVAAKTFSGPRHDPQNRLLAYFYYMQFRSDREAEEIADRKLDEYLSKDLPQNESLPKPLRAAIASEIHLNQAISLIDPGNDGSISPYFRTYEDTRAIRKSFQESVRAYPANRQAYASHAKWIKSKLNDDRLTKPEREPHVRELATVMKKWAKGLPEDVEPRLWLVDHLLENEKVEDAKPHVDWLAATRQDDPRVRATPWKWQLMEAMRLSRRKAWLAQIPASLDEAESKWPAWLSREWLPYLRAAWTLRCGKTDEFEEQRRQICDESGVARDSVADACMMLGAAQRMRVPAADLKPLRAPVDRAVKDAKELPLEELLRAGRFFWDLHRTQMLYPAYRMHGGKLAKETYSRLTSQPNIVLDRSDDELIHGTILWCSEFQLRMAGYRPSSLAWDAEPAIKQHPIFAAARVNDFLGRNHHWGAVKLKDNIELLRAAAQTERDPFYRHWFASLANDFEELVTKDQRGPFGFATGAFERMFGFDDGYDEGDDDDDDEEDLGFDEGCDCPDCRRARLEYEKSHS